MLIQIGAAFINPDSIEQIYFYEQDYTNARCCAVILKSGERFDLDTEEQLRSIKDFIKASAVVFVVSEGTET